MSGFQCFDGIDVRGFPSRVDASKNAEADGDQGGNDDCAAINEEREMLPARDDLRAANANEDAEKPTSQGKAKGLKQELG
jgi:hypothetical protein